MEDFSRWLSVTDLSLFLQVNLQIIPAVQTVHILTLSALGGALLMIVAKVLFGAGARPLPMIARQFFPWIYGGLVVLLITGTILVIAEPLRSLTNIMFYIKMTLVLAILGVIIGLDRRARATPDMSGTARPRYGAVLPSLAVIGSCLFVAIVFAGRWIAYTETWASY